jgi:hypothetical protein
MGYATPLFVPVGIMALLRRLWINISKPKKAPPFGVRLTCFAHLDDEYPPDYLYPPMWRKEWDRKYAERKHAERTAASLSIVKMDPVVELSKSLKAAGIHPSQLAPVTVEPRTTDPCHSGAVKAPSKPQPGRLVRWLDTSLCKVLGPLVHRSLKDRRKD